MEYLMSLVLLLVCVLSHCEPLQQAVQRRRDVFGVYANDFARDYEPIAFAAVPLHAPLPVIHIVSAAPLPMTRYPPPPQSQRQRIPSPYTVKPSYSHNVPSYIQAPTSFAPNAYAQPTAYLRQPNQMAYAQQVDTYAQSSDVYHQQPNYAPSMAYTTNVDPPETEDDGLTILYARPQPHGGYTYRRRPAKKRVPPKRKEPVIIRVHKYRVVKGR